MSINERMDKKCGAHMRSAMKERQVLAFATTCKTLLSETNQAQKDKYCTISHMWNCKEPEQNDSCQGWGLENWGDTGQSVQTSS